AVGGADKEQIANRRDRATAHVVLGDAQLFHHVVDPDDVGFVGGFRHFAGEGAIVFAVVEALSIQALHFATAGDEPQAFAFHQRRAADALQRPVVHAAGGQLFAAVLPEELAVALAEGQQAAQVDVGRVALQPAAAVIGAHVNLAAGDHRVAVGLRAQPRNPLDVFTGTSHPFAGFVVELADVPRLGQVLHRGSVVAGRRATPLGPIVGFLVSGDRERFGLSGFHRGRFDRAIEQGQHGIAARGGLGRLAAGKADGYFGRAAIAFVLFLV